MSGLLPSSSPGGNPPTFSLDGASPLVLHHLRLLVATAWGAALAAGAFLRWSHPELAEFGIDQQTALHLARGIARGWEYPLHGQLLGVGSVAGPIEPYLMAIPQFASDSPEFSAAYMGALSLLGGLAFAYIVARHYGQVVGLGTLLLYATGPWVVYYSRKIWTPDAFLFFSGVLFSLLVLALAERRRWALPLAFFVLGLEIQLHLAALVLLPAVGLALLLFWRRLRAADLLAGMALFVLVLAPYGYHNFSTDFSDLRFLVEAGGQQARFDLASFEVLTWLVAGLDFPSAIGLSFPAGPSPEILPVVSWLIAVAFWGGIAFATTTALRGVGQGSMPPRLVVASLALLMTLIPALLNTRHSVPIYFRYELYLLPVAFFFPALSLASLGQGLARAWTISSQRRGRIYTLALPLCVIAILTASGVVQSEVFHRAMAAGGYRVAMGTKDVYSGPPISETRLALASLETILRPEVETILVGNVNRGPLEYLANDRYRLRFSDDPRVLVVPSNAATIAVLPEGAKVADLAVAFGARERSDARLAWPPDDRQARIFDFGPEQSGLPAGFTAVDRRQVLANGLELVGYSIGDGEARSFDVTLVWRVVNTAWARKYYLYNSFVNVYGIDGTQVPARGEVELSTSSNWRHGDLLVVPTRVELDAEVRRGLYRLDAGVYVRFPPRVPIAKECDSVEVATLGPVRLGRPTLLAGAGDVVATFGSAVSMRSAVVNSLAKLRAVEVKTAWVATQSIGRDLTLFVHIYGPAGNLIAQSDGWPGGAIYPTSAWLPMEEIYDVRTLVLPEQLQAGTYVVRIGMYDSATMQRLAPSPDHGNRSVVVGVVEITP